MDSVLNNTVVIETLSPIRVACLRVVSASPELDARARLDRWIASLSLTTPGRKFGFDVEVTPSEERAGLRGYEVWETLPIDAQPTDGIRIQDFPGGLYAAVMLDRCFDAEYVGIHCGWKDLHTWVIQSQGYQSAGHQWLEEVLPMDYGETLKLYHPVMPTD